MRIVFFTNKTTRGAEILKSLVENDVPLEAIFIDEGKKEPKSRLLKIKHTHQRMGFLETFKYIRKRLRKQYKRKPIVDWKRNKYYRSFSEKLYLVSSFNSERSEALLKEINPDLVVIGGARIIRKHIIDIPKIGILNPHPGLLPEYRGVDVIPWAVYHGDPIGVTIHFVDSGIDTGAIVAQRPIEISRGDTLAVLMKKANELAGKLMAEVVLKIIQDGHIQAFPQSRNAGEQFYRMPLSLRQEVEEMLRNRIVE